MEQRTLKTFMIILLLIVSGYAYSQKTAINDTADYPYWIQMMQDPDENFYKTQRAFNLYWEGREITKGCGWKPFKRWESNMMLRASVDGELPRPTETKQELEKFLAKYSTKSPQGNWISLGPDDFPAKGYKGLGRLNAIAFHPTDPDIIYVGSPSGGFWYTTVGGNEWVTTTDDHPTLGVSAIIVDHSNPNIIYIGTGDRDANDAPGLGVYKSYDAGHTWEEASTGMGYVTVGAMLIHPTNPQILYAGTSGGIFKSTDGAATWSKIHGVYAKDLAFKPGNPNVIYACHGGSFSYSTNGGSSWNIPSSGYVLGERAVLAVTPANPEVVYVMTSNSSQGFKGLYRSLNSGVNFTEMSNSPNIQDWSCYGTGSGGQAWYNLCLVADPEDANIIYSGGVNIWRSANGGSTWNINGHWTGDCGVPAVHADHHVFEVNPINNRIYVGNDGGIYWTDNDGISWNEITTGLVISQAYKIGQSATNPDVIVNGYQDNGSSVYANGLWYFVSGGDGMECAVLPTDDNIRFSSLYYGQIMRINGIYNQGSIAGQGINGITESGAWVTPYIIDEQIPTTMFIGYKNIWRSRNITSYNVTWKKISNMNTGNFTVVEQSPLDNNLIFASSGSRLFYSEDVQNETEMPTWFEISDKLPNNDRISDIECHPEDRNTLYISLDKKIFKTTDFCETWEDISLNLPAIHINSIAHYKNSLNGLYLGTDAGVYYKDDSMSEWIFFNNGMPLSASVREIEIYYSPDSPADDKLSAGTYGRGTWQSEPYSSAPVADFTSNKILVTKDCEVDFTDLSSGVPFTWDWEFTGGTPSVSTDKNPSGITYSQIGTYPVKLTVSNNEGTDTKVVEGYIVVSDTLLPLPAFTSSTNVVCNIDEVVSFTNQTENCPTTYKWYFNPNTIEYVGNTQSNSQNPKVKFLERNSYTVTLEASNINGTRRITKQDYILAGGYSLPFVEDFENAGFNAKKWTVENPDNLITWDITEVQGSNPGNKAAWMNFFEYRNTSKSRDRLISPPLSFEGLNQVFLNFEYAYASRYQNFSDTLIVFISDDCGENWTRVATYGEDGTANFVTVPRQLTSFAPTSPDEWCDGTYGGKCKSIDLSQWSNQSGIKIAFETVNRMGNNLYLDNITISQHSGVDITEKDNTFTIYPNPAKDEAVIECNPLPYDASISIVNVYGKVVFSKDFAANQAINCKVNTSSFAKGIYVVNLKSKGASISKKLVIN